MKPPAGIKGVAARAGVSVGTVSNVLNRPELVATATRERVLAAMRELSFVRNESARQLRAGRSRTIGLVVLDIGNPFFTDVARGAEEVAFNAGLAMMLCSSEDQLEREQRYLDLFEEQRVQGVLVSPVGDDSAGIARLRRRGTPVVLVDHRSRQRSRCSVAVDDIHGGYLAMRHLLESGHTKVAYVGGPTGLAQVRDRRVGAERAVEEAGRKPGSLRVIETALTTVADGRFAAARLAAGTAAKRPTGVFCANDLIAIGMLQELMALGFRIPHDIALIGYDDIDFAAAAAVPLSSVRQPRHELGRKAAELLIEEASSPGKHRHQQVLFRPELVIRDST